MTLRARWVTLRDRWVTLSARWVTLRARLVALIGFHIKWEDVPIQPHIKDWPVSIINMPRIGRHNDA